MARGKGKGRGVAVSRGAKMGGKNGSGGRKAAAEVAPPVPSSDDRDATAEHNVGNRRDAMQDALQRVYALDTEIHEITEEHLKPLREDKSGIMTSLRERFGLTAKVFRARYYGYRLERDAAASNDEVTQDAIRELFEVCPVTGQGSFAAVFDAPPVTRTRRAGPPTSRAAVEPAPAAADPEAEADVHAVDAEVDPEAAWQAGHDARRANKVKGSCPHKHGALRARWGEGWEASDAEINRANGGHAANALPA